MKEKICGIYKITNKINNKAYIGQSIDIYERWSNHIRASHRINEKQYSLQKALNKYGIENFTFEIIEICSSTELNTKEEYWIQYYDTYNNGYNETKGGDNPSNNFTCRTLSKEMVLEIRKRRLNAENFSDVYKDYIFLPEGTFKNIWNGIYYPEYLPEGFTPENIEKVKIISKRNISAARKESKMTEDIVLQIRTDKKNGMKRKDGYIKYGHLFKSIGGFDSIWYNQRWKDIQPE